MLGCHGDRDTPSAFLEDIQRSPKEERRREASGCLVEPDQAPGEVCREPAETDDRHEQWRHGNRDTAPDEHEGDSDGERPAIEYEVGAESARRAAMLRDELRFLPCDHLGKRAGRCGKRGSENGHGYLQRRKNCSKISVSCKDFFAENSAEYGDVIFRIS